MPARVIDAGSLQDLIGQEVGTSDWLQVSQSMIDAFAELTGDRQWIHTDPVRAKSESPYGTTVAHGFLTLSLVSQLQSQSIEFHGDFNRAINYGFDRIRFPAPVPAGARIRTHSVLAAVAAIDGGLQLTWNITAEIEGHTKPALAALWLVRVYR